MCICQNLWYWASPTLPVTWLSKGSCISSGWYKTDKGLSLNRAGKLALNLWTDFDLMSSKKLGFRLVSSHFRLGFISGVSKPVRMHLPEMPLHLVRWHSKMVNKWSPQDCWITFQTSEHGVADLTEVKSPGSTQSDKAGLGAKSRCAV